MLVYELFILRGFTMLTDNQKLRIREEEIYRDEVRKSLVKPDGFFKRFYNFLNSALGLWILTTIVVGVFTWGYAQWQLSVQSREQINKLDIEIEKRFDNAANSLFVNSPDWKEGDKQPPFYIANTLLLPPKEENSIQSEFANRNLKSLLYELNSRLPFIEKIEVENTIRDIDFIEQFYAKKDIPQPFARDFYNKIMEIRNSRWSYEKMTARNFNDPLYWDKAFNVIILFVVILAGFFLIFSLIYTFPLLRQFQRLVDIKQTDKSGTDKAKNEPSEPLSPNNPE